MVPTMDSLRTGSHLGYMREMRPVIGEAARAWGKVGGAGRSPHALAASPLVSRLRHSRVASRA